NALFTRTRRVGGPLHTDARLPLLVVDVWREVRDALRAKRFEKSRFEELEGAVAAVLKNHLPDLGQIHGRERPAASEIELRDRLREGLLHLFVQKTPDGLTRQ